MGKAENSVQEAVLEYLTILHVFCWRTNNIPVYDPVRKCHRSMPKFSLKGVADILGIMPDGTGRLLAIECKAPGGSLSKEQREFRDNVRRLGGVYIVIDSCLKIKQEIDWIFQKRG